jgi:hypothetical protein
VKWTILGCVFTYCTTYGHVTPRHCACTAYPRLHPSFLLSFLLVLLLVHLHYMHGIARESCVDQLSRRSRFFTISSRFRVQDRITTLTRPASELANSKTIETFSFNRLTVPIQRLLTNVRVMIMRGCEHETAQRSLPVYTHDRWFIYLQDFIWCEHIIQKIQTARSTWPFSSLSFACWPCSVDLLNGHNLVG